MSTGREIVAFGSYYKDFMATLHDKERRKVLYVLSLFMANSFQKQQVCGIRLHRSMLDR